ncbi:MAG: hypothetical protein QGI45_08830, partial [Myxococcota bacterium]|nr:hypothetical protein [Myxococcota bacterium]
MHNSSSLYRMHLPLLVCLLATGCHNGESLVFGDSLLKKNAAPLHEVAGQRTHTSKDSKDKQQATLGGKEDKRKIGDATSNTAWIPVP